jgi:DNA-binding NarL/FixJ family response regulator
MASIKVLIADDHRDFRRVVREFLDRIPNVSVVGEATNGGEAIAQVELLVPDVVLMDISMPQMNGLEATRIIKQRWPDTKVLIATTYDDPTYRLQALDARADGYILKGSLKPSLEATFGVQRSGTSI